MKVVLDTEKYSFSENQSRLTLSNIGKTLQKTKITVYDKSN